jgi:hypothetical protein
MPFAVVGSTHTFDVGGRNVRGRKYPWGIVDGSASHANLFQSCHYIEFYLVNNEAHCDFTRLRSMLVRYLHRQPNLTMLLLMPLQYADAGSEGDYRGAFIRDVPKESGLNHSFVLMI